MTATGETRQFLDEDATKLLLAYGLRLKSLARIWKGTISQNFRAETDIGPVFVRISPGRSVVDAEFETRLIWHLQSHGLRTAALFQAHNRDGYVVLPGKPKALAMVYEWLDGYELTDDKFDEKHAHEVGQLLGQLHLCTATLTPRREGIYTPAHIRQRLTRLERHPLLTTELQPLLARLRHEAEQLTGHHDPSLPAGIGHCDLFPDNLLFPRSRCRRTPRGSEPGPWMIDLEQAAWTTFVYDLAVTLLACAAPLPDPSLPDPSLPDPSLSDEEVLAKRCGPLLVATARALMAGYQRMRLLTDGEWTALWWALRQACVRFTTTRLTDVHLHTLEAARAASELPPAASPSEPAKPTLAPSKDYRDYVYRLDRLDEIDADRLITALR